MSQEHDMAHLLKLICWPVQGVWPTLDYISYVVAASPRATHPHLPYILEPTAKLSISCYITSIEIFIYILPNMFHNPLARVLVVFLASVFLSDIFVCANAVDFPALLVSRTLDVEPTQYAMGSPNAHITQAPSAEEIASHLEKRVDYNTCSEWSILNGT